MQRFLRRILPALLAAWMLLGCGVVRAADLIVERGVLVDESGSLGIAEVADATFRPFTGTFSGGFTRTVHWFRIVVQVPEGTTELALRIRPTVLDEVRLYEAGSGPPEAWKTRATGDRHPYEERDRAGTALGFVVRPSTPQAVYFLRMQTTSTSTLSVEAMGVREADRLDHELDTIQLLFAGLMIWPLAWALQNFVARRESAVGIFAFHQAVYVLFGLSVTGYLAPLGPPALVDTLTSVVVCLVLFSSSLFARALLRSGEPPRTLALGLDLLLAMFPLQMVAMLVGRTELALGVNAALVLASRWYFVLVAFSLRKEGSPSRRFLQLVMLVLALLVTATLPANFGWALFPDLNLRDAIALVVFGLVSSSLFVALLSARLAQARQQAEQNEVQLLLTRRALALEQALKKQAEEQANTDGLTRLCNRRHFEELAERELARASRYRAPITLLMLDLDHFKRINDTLGHEAGDQVLRSVSEVLRGSLREIDVLARIGGEEFAILLPETPPGPGLQVAERIRAAIARTPVTVGGGATIPVTISIGLAEPGTADKDLRALMRAADRALYEAKQGGRNRVACASPA